MAEGTESIPLSQSQFILNSDDTEPLQVLKPSTAPGASSSTTENTLNCQSRHGIFRVFAGMSPRTSTSMADSQLHNNCMHRNTTPFTTSEIVNDVTGSIMTGSLLRKVNTTRSESNMWLPGYGLPRFSSDPRLHDNMAAHKNNDAMMRLLYEQSSETKELFKQQQSTIEKLTDLVNSMANKRTSTQRKEHSDSSDDEVSQYDMISSADDLSDPDSDKEPGCKKQKMNDDLGHLISNKKILKLKAVESQFSKQIEYGPAVHEVVASTVNKGLSEPVEHKSSTIHDLLTKYNRPENCSFLDVPKVNKVLWSNRHTAKELKQGDKLLQRTHSYLTKGMIPIIQIMNKTLDMDSEEAEELFDLSLDAFNLLAYAHRDFSSQRRRLLTPAISSRYADLCDDSEKISSATHLFGDDTDLEKRLKEIDDSQKLSKNLTVLASGNVRHQIKAGHSKWGMIEHHRHKYTATSSRNFLGRRTLGHQPAYRQQRAGMKKMDQGRKKNQGHHQQ